MTVDPKLYHLLFETFKGELTDQQQVMVDALLSLEKTKNKKKLQELLDVLFRVSHNLKGAAKSVSIDAIAEIAHQLEDSFSVWREENITPNKKQINDCLVLSDSMLEILNALEQEKAGGTLSADEMLRVPSRRVERVNAKIDELIITQLRLSSWSKKTASVMHSIARVESDKSSDDSNFLPIKRELMGLLDDAEKLSGEFSRDLFTLQQEGRTMRLLPINHILSPLKRTVREISESLGKEVQLVIEGESIEIDKSILDLLKTPIQHLVRNAIAHGIEKTALRKKKKKPVPATLRIKAFSEAGQMKLLISDDGQGLDIEKIKQAAESKKLYTANALNLMREQELFELIFHSGLSTADGVSELSGRGVGLDAVFSDIKRAKGNIQVHSVAGQGCDFILTLPLALASSRGLFIKLQSVTYMLPTVSLNALHEIRCEQLKRIDNQWVKVVNQVPIAVFSLLELLGMGNGVLDPTKRYDGVLIGSDDAQVIVLVDEIVEEHDCVLKPLPFPLNQLKYLTGATLTEKGMLVLALNTDDLLKKVFEKKVTSLNLDYHPKQGDEGKSEVDASNKSILVVDDALTTRTLAINALRAAGYDTMDADDGKKALSLLQKNTFDCVITDIEMPVMNGFQLTSAIKSDKKLAHLPVVIVSSREQAEDKAHGIEVGASAYLVKKDFDTRTLINMVESLL